MEATRRRSLRRTPKSRPRAGLPTGMRFTISRRLNQTFSFYKIPVQPVTRILNAVATTLLTGLEAEPSFALSADGTRLVYARAPFYSNLWMLEAGAGVSNQTTETKELTHGTSLIERPSISPDGTSVVFNIGHEGRANLYVMPITGGSPKQLTFLDSFNLGGVWSPDGKRIAFASTQGGTPRVWTVDAAGGIPRPLVSSDLSGRLRSHLVPGDSDPFSATGESQLLRARSRDGARTPLAQRARSAGFSRRSIRPTARK